MPCRRIVLAIALILGRSVARGDVTPNSLFADHAVLQQGKEDAVWGTAGDGEQITVEFAGQKLSTAAKDGKWAVKLAPMPVGGPYVMTIRGSNTVTLSDLYVGEVWVCGGQSNMERQLGPHPAQPLIDRWTEEAAAANYPQIREFTVKRARSTTPLDDVTGKWEVCTPESVVNFTAVGYFFGRDLYNAIHVPIGLLHSSVGGTPAEDWTSHDALAGQPELKSLYDDQAKAVEEYPAKLAQFKKDQPDLMEKYQAAVEQAKQDGKPAPRKPSPPPDPSGAGPSCLYNAMIAPLLPYSICGVIWYQGESNGSRAKQYQTLFPTLIADWRSGWHEGDFPFLFVQLAPYRDTVPEIREAQLLTLAKSPNTAMVVTVDCGFLTNIHPPHKQPVGARLALAARALAYHEKIEYSGPLYDSMKIDAGRAILSFTHVDRGLSVPGNEPLKGFTIAGADGKFIPATAEIQGDTVVVHADGVAHPAAVRYGWANMPDVNLYNQSGLPASPFCTDVGTDEK